MRANFYENVGGDEYVIEVPVPGLEQSEIVIEPDPESWWCAPSHLAFATDRLSITLMGIVDLPRRLL